MLNRSRSAHEINKDRENQRGEELQQIWRDEKGSFQKISYGGRVLRNTSAMTAEREG